MAVDLWPYSARNGGAVSDVEHEHLWSGTADGVLPFQTTTACAAGLSGSNWTVNPGKFRIAGHVLDLQTVQTGTLPAASTAVRRSVIVAFIDRTQSPWTYGVQLAVGSPGGGRPTLKQDREGLYQVPLRAFDTATNGTVTLLADERIMLTRDGGGLLRGTSPSSSQIPLLVTAAEDQSGVMASFRKPDGYRMFDISAVGRTGINTNGPSNTIGLYVKGAATNDVTARFARLPGQTSDILQVVNESSGQMLSVDRDGNLLAHNFTATDWTDYTPLWEHTGAASFSVNTGRWKRIGIKTVVFRVYAKVGVAGTGVSSDVTFRLPTICSRAVEHTFHGRTRGPGFHLVASALASGTSTVVNEIAMVNSSITSNMQGADMASGMEIAIGGTYEEA